MRRLAVLLTLVVGLSGVLVGGTVSTATAGGKEPVPFGMAGFGFGAKVKGGDLPAGVGPIAQAVVACRNVAGFTRTNATASADLPGIGRIDGVETRVWTRKVGSTVSAYSRHRIADVVLLENITGKISLVGVESWARVWHDGRRFHAKTRTSLLGLKYTPPGGDPISLPLPSLGEPIKIPGVATIGLGSSTKVVRPGRAKAMATGLRIHLDELGTTVALAYANAHMGEAPNGIFGGNAFGIQANALGDIVGVGKTPRITMPCAGTDGEIQTNALAGVNVPGLATVGALEVSQRANAVRRRAKGWEQAKLAHVSLLGGAIEVDGVTARAFVKKVKGKRRLVRSSEGTEVLQIKVNGEAVAVPLEGLTIPGLAKIEEGIVKRLPTGIDVTALRITLLDPESVGVVVNIGVARVRARHNP